MFIYVHSVYSNVKEFIFGCNNIAAAQILTLHQAIHFEKEE